MKTFWIITGRVPEDDENSMLIIEDEDMENAVKRFAAELSENIELDAHDDFLSLVDFDAYWGTEGGVFIVDVVRVRSDIAPEIMNRQ